jgi:hypothetical protein
MVLGAAMLVPALAQTDAIQPLRIDQIRQRLNLTEDQQQKIRPILEEEETKLQGIRAAHSQAQQQDRAQILSELRGVQQDSNQRIVPLLNKDQRAEWRLIRQQARTQLQQAKGKAKGKNKQQ